MNPIDRVRFLADLDRYMGMLDRFGSEPSIGLPSGEGAGMPQVFFVDSGTGVNTNNGKRPSRAVATLDYAIGLCTASRGDIIVVLPGHAETYTAASSLVCDVAGVTVIGIGEGAERPTFTLSATTSTMTVTAASVHLENLLFITTAVVVAPLTVTGADFYGKDLAFRNSTTNTPVIGITLTTGAARATIDGLHYDTGTNTGASGAIDITAVLNGITIKDCIIFGDFSDACIHSASAHTNTLIKGCMLTNLNTGDHSIEFTAAATGNLVENYYHTDMTQQTGVDPGSMFSFECYQDDAIDTGAILTPIIT